MNTFLTQDTGLALNITNILMSIAMYMAGKRIWPPPKLLLNIIFRSHELEHAQLSEAIEQIESARLFHSEHDALRAPRPDVFVWG